MSLHDTVKGSRWVINVPAGEIVTVHAVMVDGSREKIAELTTEGQHSVTAQSGKMEVSDQVKKPEFTDCDSFLQAVREGGVVGLGGAAFPLWGKFDAVRRNKVDTVLINGAECEPYITGDHRAMLERPEQIIGGATYLAKMFGVDKVIIGVEDNKMDGI